VLRRERCDVLAHKNPVHWTLQERRRSGGHSWARWSYEGRVAVVDDIDWQEHNDREWGFYFGAFEIASMRKAAAGEWYLRAFEQTSRLETTDLNEAFAAATAKVQKQLENMLDSILLSLP